MKKYRIAYFVSTGLLSALMLMSATMYFFNTAVVKETFLGLGYPEYIVYPLGIAKILGIIALWTKFSAKLKEWAYAGFFFNLLLAFSAHLMANDGESGGAVIGMVLFVISYTSYSKLNK